jgi:hypothetical protein
LENSDLTFQPTISKVLPDFSKINSQGIGNKEKEFIKRCALAKKNKEEMNKRLNPDYSIYIDNLKICFMKK